MRTFEKSRFAIEIFDEKMLELIALRMDEVEVIGAHKKQKGLPVKDVLRERRIINALVKKGESLGLEETFVKNLYTLIINHSCALQEIQHKGSQHVT